MVRGASVLDRLALLARPLVPVAPGEVRGDRRSQLVLLPLEIRDAGARAVDLGPRQIEQSLLLRVGSNWGLAVPRQLLRPVVCVGASEGDHGRIGVEALAGDADPAEEDAGHLGGGGEVAGRGVGWGPVEEGVVGQEAGPGDADGALGA